MPHWLVLTGCVVLGFVIGVGFVLWWIGCAFEGGWRR